eukprot:gene2180-2044_t
MTKSTKTVEEKKKVFRPKLHVNALVTGYRRNMVRQIRHTSILRLQGVKERKDATFYLGKRVAYLTKSAKNTKNSVHKSFQGRRVIWGKVIKTHGSSGSVKVKFNPQLPPSSIGRRAKVFLYPSNI